MWLLIHSIPPSPTAPQQLAAPIAALVHTSTESATTIINSLGSLAEHDQLEAFLPYELEFAFASAMLLCIVSAILPAYIPDGTWLQKSRLILDVMIRKRNVVAQLRKSELEQLEALLTPFRRDTAAAGAGASKAITADAERALGNLPHSDNVDYSRQGDVFDAPFASITLGDDFNPNDPGLAWDALYDGGRLAANSEQMLNLAEQFEMGDFDAPFFFGP